MKKVLSAVLLAFAISVLGVAAPAYGQSVGRSQADLPQAYAMFTIANLTPDVTITYHVRWGNGRWRSATLLPGQSEHHWYPLDAVGNAPIPHIVFDNVVNGRGRRAYHLLPSAVNFGQAGTFGNPTPYAFQMSADGRLVDLFGQ
jgi:hypothetical protein